MHTKGNFIITRDSAIGWVGHPKPNRLVLKNCKDLFDGQVGEMSSKCIALLKISLEVGLGWIELSLVGLYFGLGCPGLGCKLGWVVLEPSIT